MLRENFSEYDIQLFDGRSVQFLCHCSSEKMLVAIKSLGQSEVDAMLEEQEAIDVTCEYCNHTYRFSPDEARRVFLK